MYESDSTGQKTGFYCDQRDNRQMIRQLSKDKSVLDLYCYSGGFAINAILGGAYKVVGVDSSQAAIDVGVKNILLNSNIDNNINKKIELIKSDAIKYMEETVNKGQVFDIVILDPPKLAPTRVSFDRARNKYIKINQLAMQIVSKGGLLLTCTCSNSVTRDNNFLNIVIEAASKTNRDVSILSVTGAAKDHGLASGYTEGSYLTAVLCHIA